MVQFLSRSMWLLVNGLSPGETEMAGNTDSISDLVSLFFQSPMSHTPTRALDLECLGRGAPRVQDRMSKNKHLPRCLAKDGYPE